MVIVYLIFLVIDIAIAVFAYNDANKRQQARGSTPWNLSPVLWAVIGFFLGIIGLVLYLVARSAHDKA